MATLASPALSKPGCIHCARYYQSTDAMHARNPLHGWRKSTDGVWYTICGRYTVTSMPANFYSVYDRASGLYSRAASIADAIMLNARSR